MYSANAWHHIGLTLSKLADSCSPYWRQSFSSLHVRFLMDQRIFKIRENLQTSLVNSSGCGESQLGEH